MNKIIKGAGAGVGGLAILAAGFFGGSASQSGEIADLKSEIAAQEQTISDQNSSLRNTRQDKEEIEQAAMTLAESMLEGCQYLTLGTFNTADVPYIQAYYDEWCAPFLNGEKEEAV